MELPNDTTPETELPETEVVETPEVETPEVETSLREDLEAALAAQTETEEQPTEEPAPAADGRERDAQGRFKAKAAAPAGAAEAAAPGKPAEAAKPLAGAPVPAPAEKPPVAAEPRPTDRAPQSWKPLEREAWAAVPPAAREAVYRREQEVQRVLQDSAQARHRDSQFAEAIRPYEAMIRTEAGDPIKAVSGLLQTAHALRTAPPQVKAQIIANLIGGYGVDVGTLDSVLAGQPVPQQGPQQPVRDQRVDELFQRLEASENARKQQVFQNVRSNVQEFASQHEFYEDVRADMADIIEMGARRGQELTMAQAYERAVALNPGIQEVVKQREAAKAAASARAQTQRARVAASSVPSRPAVAPRVTRGDTSLREDIEESMRELSGH